MPIYLQAISLILALAGFILSLLNAVNAKQRAAQQDISHTWPGVREILRIAATLPRAGIGAGVARRQADHGRAFLSFAESLRPVTERSGWSPSFQHLRNLEDLSEKLATPDDLTDDGDVQARLKLFWKEIKVLTYNAVLAERAMGSRALAIEWTMADDRVIAAAAEAEEHRQAWAALRGVKLPPSPATIFAARLRKRAER